jgi:predicted DNA-binding transcriptional regulator YafY
MRASRLLSILLLLQTRGRMSAAELADEFETSVRTIYRDIDELSAAGVPVYAERGRSGGFQLMDGYRTRLTGLTPDEAEALFLSGVPGPAADLGMGEAMAGAQLKLLAALPEDKRSSAARVAGRFHLDPVGWYRSPDAAATPDVLPRLAEAVWGERAIRIRYESWTGVVDRELEPLGLALKGGGWYLVARAGRAVRAYKIAAVRALELTDRHFKRPDDFDLAAWWAAWAREFEQRLFSGEAQLRLSPGGFRRLAVLAPAVGEAAARTAGPPDADGWTVVAIPIESIDHAAGEVLKLGVEAEVLAPPELRARMKALGAALSAIYA